MRGWCPTKGAGRTLRTGSPLIQLESLGVRARAVDRERM
jgi:hypothetical protein